ncbi:MAG: ornithine carbamoyltransferase [Nitrospirae bacterium]|nr:ornithine carbamoyltransferase [Nitrospirota bacterium]MBI5695148.1 ornithine carbamoyltransferase [Nitrospirota bacterium]
MKKDFLTLGQLSEREFWDLMDRTRTIKQRRQKGQVYQPLLGKTLAMVFEKSSTRTRVSFEAGMFQLGGHALFLSPSDTQISRGEEVRDTARVLSRYVDAIMVRTFRQETVEEMARYASVPVINGLTDKFHPCQVLADLFTIQETLGALKCLKIAYIGDGNNMANTLIEGAVRAEMNISLACPKGFEPDKDVLARHMDSTNRHGMSRVELVTDPLEAAKGANVIYTDVWVSMGQEGENAERAKAFKGYQVNQALLDVARPDALVMHCLPAHRGEEITDDVMEGSHSAVFDQAENRLHVQKALLEMLIAG